MSNEWQRTLIVMTGPSTYGFALGLAGFGAAGVGHGTYVIMGPASSPLGSVNDVVLAWIGAPVLWAFVGFLLGRVQHIAWRVAFFATMLAHYSGLFFILRPPGRFADWEHARKQSDFVA